MRGRKPKPVAQQIREGNPRQHRLPVPIRIAGGGRIPRPPDMPLEAVELWDEVVGRLETAGVIDLVDRASLHAMCMQWARAAAARQVLAEEGIFDRGSMGQLVEHPALGIERQAHALFLRFAEQYGLTAAARARISATSRVGRGRDELDAILNAEPVEID